jgi:hypothetical protein
MCDTNARRASDITALLIALVRPSGLRAANPMRLNCRKSIRFFNKCNPYHFPNNVTAREAPFTAPMT